jgi:hypothetical protein
VKPRRLGSEAAGAEATATRKVTKLETPKLSRSVKLSGLGRLVKVFDFQKLLAAVFHTAELLDFSPF